MNPRFSKSTARLTYPIPWGSYYRKRRPQNRSCNSSVCRRGYPSSRSLVAFRRRRNERSSGADERHAAHLQRIQSRPWLRARDVRPPCTNICSNARRCHSLLGLSAFHGSYGAQLPSRPIRHAETTLDAGSSGAVDGSKALPAFAIRRFNEFLLFLPHVVGMV